jgi:membrane protein YdbS with pleckstrin-like domain
MTSMNPGSNPLGNPGLNPAGAIPASPLDVPPVTAAAPTGPHAPPDHEEIVYYEGSPLARGAVGPLLLWGLIGLVLIAIPVAAWVFNHPLYWWADLILVLLGLIMFVIPSLRNRSIRYRITNYRIDYERGILGKNIDTLELWHVEDLHFHQSLMGRVLNFGSIIVTSRDETLPRLELHSLPNPRPLYETLKQRVIAVKRSQGVLKVDPG